MNRSGPLIASLATLCLLLAGGCAWLWLRRPSATPAAGPITDPHVLAAAVRALVERGEGAADNFPDPDVGRALQPDLERREVGMLTIDTNRFGLRERDFEVPKPHGVLRVVILGDSYVYGNGVTADERLGVQLEQYLAGKAPPGGPRIECLHFGIAGWNIVAESSFMRRWLSKVEPDLVVHVTVYNDLEDAPEARGFGSMANFSSQHRERGDSMVTMHIARVLSPKGESLLNAGLDWESRERYERSALLMKKLADAVETCGGRYLAVFYWPQFLWRVRESLAARLRPEQIAWLPSSLRDNLEYRVSASDDHWGGAGHAYVARMLYGLIRERGLLGPSAFPEWALATEAVERLHRAGEAESLSPPEPLVKRRFKSLSARLNLHEYEGNEGGQVYAGIDERGLASPYVSVVLANPNATRLTVKGKGLARPELKGDVRVYVEELEVGRFALPVAGAVDQSFPVPAELAQRPMVSVRLVSDDWCYEGPDMRHMVCFQLDEIALGR